MRVKFTTSIESELITAIKIQAIKENTDVNRILEKLISQYLGMKSVEELEESE